MRAAAKSLMAHGAILMASAASAAFVWLRDTPPPQAVVRDVVVWKGRETDVDRVEFKRLGGYNVVLEGKRDGAGRWYEGHVHEDKAPSPHGGASGAGGPRDAVFASVTPATKLVESLADLRALRALGRTPPERDAEFGLKDGESSGTLTLTARGATHELVLGALTPGGTDRYVRDAHTGEVFAVEAEPYRLLEGADHTLVEREMHGFALDPDVVRLEVSAGGKRRAWSRGGPPTNRFFSDPGAPDKVDETVTTWMTKVNRLSPMEFVAGEPKLDEAARIRITYEGSKEPLGFLEIARGSGEPEVYIRSERTRIWSKVVRSSGDQVFADVDSLLK